MQSTTLYQRWNNVNRLYVTQSNAAFCQGFYECKFGPTYIGIDGVGNEYILIYLDKASAESFETPNVSGLTFEIVQDSTISETDKFLKIGIAPNHEQIKEAFEAFTVSLVSRIALISYCGEAVEDVYQVCHDYSDFFGKNGNAPLSAIEEQGLFGELLILEECMNRVGDKAIEAWMGPEKSRHDFVFESNRSLEVKTSLKQNRKIISVSNDMQLSNTPNADLFLKLIILEVNPSGLTLGDLISRVFEKIQSLTSKDLFDRKLLENKVVRGRCPSIRRYLVVETHQYCVDEAFPRLTVDMVRSISTRIYDLKYKVDLDGFEEFKGDVYGSLGI